MPTLTSLSSVLRDIDSLLNTLFKAASGNKSNQIHGVNLISTVRKQHLSSDDFVISTLQKVFTAQSIVQSHLPEEE